MSISCNCSCSLKWQSAEMRLPRGSPSSVALGISGQKPKLEPATKDLCYSDVYISRDKCQLVSKLIFITITCSPLQAIPKGVGPGEDDAYTVNGALI